MKLYLASDHRGFKLKELIKHYLLQSRQSVVDCGADTYDPEDDYVDFAANALARPRFKVGDRAILLCGSGHGMDIAANRFPHIRAILGFNPDVVEQGRQHEDANVLIIPTDWTPDNQAKVLVDTFLTTPFSEEKRHQRRLKKLHHIHLS